MKKFLINVVIIVVVVIAAIFFINKKLSNSPIGQAVNQITQSAPAIVKPDATVLVQEIQKLNRIETNSLNLNGIYTTTKDDKRLWGLWAKN